MSTPEKRNTSTDNSEDVIPDSVEDGKGVNRLEDPVASVEDAAAELESLRAQLELSQAKGRQTMERLRDTHERMLRAVADLENFKKRAHKEKEEVQKFGNERLLCDFVPVMDNLERALQHAKSNADFDSLLAGLVMTRKQFEDALARHGVRSFSAVGQRFDPHLHEAMQHVETTEVPPHHVVSEMVRGYTLNERLVRPALVLVAKPPQSTANIDSGDGAGSEMPGGTQREEEQVLPVPGPWGGVTHE